MPFNLGVPELIIVLFIVLVIFGAGRIAEFGSGLGRGIREFKSAIKEDTDEDKKTV